MVFVPFFEYFTFCCVINQARCSWSAVFFHGGFRKNMGANYVKIISFSGPKLLKFDIEMTRNLLSFYL